MVTYRDVVVDDVVRWCWQFEDIRYQSHSLILISELFLGWPPGAEPSPVKAQHPI